MKPWGYRVIFNIISFSIKKILRGLEYTHLFFKIHTTIFVVTKLDRTISYVYYVSQALIRQTFAHPHDTRGAILSAPQHPLEGRSL